MSVDRPQVRGNLLGILVGGGCLHPGASLIQREAFFRVGGFDPQLKVREDFDLENRLALLGDFDRTDHVVVAVRIGRVGSTTDWVRVTQEHRLVREKVLNATGAVPRLLDSIGSDIFRRGRVSRAYLFSAGLNLKSGRLFTATSRLLTLVRIAGIYPVLPDFWRGLRFRSHWHSVEKQKEEAHYAARYSERNVTP